MHSEYNFPNGLMSSFNSLIEIHIAVSNTSTSPAAQTFNSLIEIPAKTAFKVYVPLAFTFNSLIEIPYTVGAIVSKLGIAYLSILLLRFMSL